jgi:hypothetical protein
MFGLLFPPHYVDGYGVVPVGTKCFISGGIISLLWRPRYTSFGIWGGVQHLKAVCIIPCMLLMILNLLLISLVLPELHLCRIYIALIRICFPCLVLLKSSCEIHVDFSIQLCYCGINFSIPLR